MAKKKTLKNGELDLDSELDFDEFNFDDIGNAADSNIKSTNRSPVIRAFKGTLGGIKSQVKDKSFLKQLLREALPEEYGDVLDRTDDVSSSLANLYNESTRSLRPVAGRAAKFVDRLVPEQYKKTRRLVDALKAKLGDDESSSSRPSAQQQNEADLQQTLKDVFTAQAESQATTQAENRAGDLLKAKLETDRFKTSHQLLSSVALNLGQLTNYNERVNAAYQKKSLELQYRHFFLMKEQAEATQRYYETAKVQSDAVIKNTAMPEYVKITQSERFSEIARTKFFESMRGGLLGDGNRIRSGFENIRKSVLGNLGDFKSSMTDAMDAADQLREAKEMMAELGVESDRVGTAGNFAGSMATGSVGSRLGKKLRSRLSRSGGRPSRLGFLTNQYANNLPGAIAAFRDSKALREREAWDDDYKGVDKLLNPGKKGLRSLLGAFLGNSADTRLDTGEGVFGLSKATVGYDQASRKTIVTIIPGYLARILREVQVLSTGNAAQELTLFDHHTDAFLTKTKAVAATRNQLRTKLNDANYDYRLDRVVEKIKGGQTLTPAAEKALRLKLAQSVHKDQLYNGKFLQSEAFYQGMAPESAAELRQVIGQEYGNAEGMEARDQALSGTMTQLRRSVQDARGEIQALVNAGQTEQLLALNIIKPRPNGGFDINMAKYQTFLVDHPEQLAGHAGDSSTATSQTPSRRRSWDGRRQSRSFGQTVTMASPVTTAPSTSERSDGTALQTLNAQVAQILTELRTQTPHTAPLQDFDFGQLLAVIAASGGGGGGSDTASDEGHPGETKVQTILRAAGYIGTGARTAAQSAVKGLWSGGKRAGVFGYEHLLKPFGAKATQGLGRLNQFRKEHQDQVTTLAQQVAAFGTTLLGQSLSYGAKGLRALTTQALPAGFKRATSMFGWGNKKVTEWLNRSQDVFVKGRDTPAMRAVILDAGGYFDKVSGRVLKFLSDIRGPVVDITGKEVLSSEEIQNGLFDVRGAPLKLKLTTAFSLATAAIGSGVSTLYGGVKGSAQWAWNKLRGKKGTDAVEGEGLSGALHRTFTSPFSYARPSYGVLVQIRDLLNHRLPGEPLTFAAGADGTAHTIFQQGTSWITKQMARVSVAKEKAKGLLGGLFRRNAFNDTDGDGRREGDWRDQLEQQEQDQSTSTAAAPDRTLRYRTGINVLDSLIDKLSGLGKLKDQLFGGDEEGIDIDMEGDKHRRGRGRLGRMKSRLGRWGRTAGRGLRSGGGRLGSLVRMGSLVGGGLSAGSAMAGVSGAASSALGGLGTAAATAGGWGAAALGGLGTAASVIGGVLASPWVLGGAALALTAYGGYKLYKHLSRNNATPVEQVRFSQYGFGPETRDGIHRAMALEQYLESTGVQYQDGKASLIQNGIDDATVLGFFDVSPDNPAHVQRFIKWLDGRFKPIFLTHKSVLRAIQPKCRLADIASLTPEQTQAYLDGIGSTAGPYDLSLSPLPDPTPLSDKADVLTALAAAKATLKPLAVTSEAVTRLRGGMVGPTALAASLATAKAAETAAHKTPNILGFLKTAIEKPLDIVKQTATFLVSVTGTPATWFESTVNALEAIRFKSYGLTTMDRDKIAALRALETYLTPLVVFGRDGTARWDGDVIKVIKDTGGQFGVTGTTDPNAVMWFSWFRNRFLPIYLLYTGRGYQQTGKRSCDDIRFALKPGRRYELALMLLEQSTVWTVRDTPWPNTVIGTDPAIVKDNVVFLKQQADAEQLPEQKARPIPPAVAPPPATTTFAQQAAAAPGDPTNAADATYRGITNPLGLALPDTPADAEGKPTATSASAAGIAKTTMPPSASGPIANSGEGDKWIVFDDKGTSLKNINPAYAEQFRAMAAEYGAKTGKRILVTSGFRTHERQAELRRQKGRAAAKPYYSMHEYGLALDVNPADVNALEKLGLMRKYGFTRPVGGEDWHVEAAGVALSLENLARARADGGPNREWATQQVRASMGRGGGGLGTRKGAKRYSRDFVDAAQIFGTAPAVAVPLPAATQSSSGGSTSANVGVSATAVPGAATAAGVDAPGALSTSPSAQPTGKYAEIKSIINEGAQRTGVDPNLLQTVMAVESSFKTSVKNSSSSAQGLAQFMPGTWKEQLGKHARTYGLSPTATPSDPKTSVILAAEYLKTNAKGISKLRPNPTAFELYLTHLLGLGGARQFLALPLDAVPANEPNPLGGQAKANKPIFYKNGRALTVREIYQHQEARFQQVAKAFGIGAPSGKLMAAAGSSPAVSVNTPTSSTTPAVYTPPAATGNAIRPVGFTPPAIDPSMTLGFQSPQTAPVDRGVAMGALNAHTDLMQIDGTLVKSLNVQQQMLGVLTQMLTTLSPETLRALTQSVTKQSGTPPPTATARAPVTKPSAPSAPAPRSGINLQRQLVG